MKIIFFGSSDFSLSALRACLDAGEEVLLVVTTPDQKKGRGLEMTLTPVKEFAQKRKLEVICPEKLKEGDWVKKVEGLKPDLFVVSSYGKMIPTAWLKIPLVGSWNVHPSLLPKYRGAAPIHWPILNGDKETGLSIAEVTPELDAGDIFYQKSLPLDRSFNAETLSARLAQMSCDAIRQMLTDHKKGKLKRTPQDPLQSSYARKLEKADGLIDWSRPALDIDQKVRGLFPWPGAYTYLGNSLIKILKVEPAAASSLKSKQPGEIVSVTNPEALEIQTSEGSLFVCEVHPEGRKIMSGAEFAHGRRISPGVIFGKK